MSKLLAEVCRLLPILEKIEHGHPAVWAEACEGTGVATLNRLRYLLRSEEGPSLYFWHDPESCDWGFTKTAFEARTKAEKAVEVENDEARYADGGYTDNAENICWGIVVAKACISSVHPCSDLAPLVLEAPK